MPRVLGIAVVVWYLSLMVQVSGAGEYNTALNIGDAAPTWEKLPGVDGKLHSLADLKEKPLVVVVFTCNSCPIAGDYEDRLIAFTRKYGGTAGQVAVVAINVNTVEADRLPKMKERAEAKQFNFPYLYDETQQIAKAYGATFTPEVFVLDKQRKIAYMGGIDDSSNPATVKNHYLTTAVDAVLKGAKPATQETVAIGCRVRYVRTKK